VGLGVKAMVAGGNVWHVLSGEGRRKVATTMHVASSFAAIFVNLRLPLVSN
jgi:hypothetical protein